MDFKFDRGGSRTSTNVEHLSFGDFDRQGKFNYLCEFRQSHTIKRKGKINTNVEKLKLSKDFVSITCVIKDVII